MDDYLPPFVEAERDALLKEIEEAFEGVERTNGVSWSQSRVLDDYGSQKDMARAKSLDHDSCWQNLLAPGAWELESGMGGFSFLDAIGFRYYLPAAMVLSVRQRYDAGILFHLMLGRSELQDYKRARWSALDECQRRCVRRFLDYMLIIEGSQGRYQRAEYLGALDGYWKAAEGEVGEVEEPKKPKRKQAARRRGGTF